MATIRFFWKIWLKLNLLTPLVDNDYTADVSTTGTTLRNEDIARLIVGEGSEIKYDTLLSILNKGDRIKREKLGEGYSLQDGVCHYSPRVKGTWIGANAKFDPAHHTITLDTTPSADMRAILAQVGVQVLGIKDSGAYIGLVTDLSTGLADETFVPGEDIAIEGDKLKIAPEGEEGLGVYLVPVDGGEPIPFKHRLSQNDRKKIIARTPANVAPGKYTLRIVTRFTNGSTLLKEQRTIDYERPISVREESGQ